MVVNLVLIHDEIGDLHDHEDHLRNAACQRIDDQGTVIPNLEGVVKQTANAENAAANAQAVAEENVQNARPITFADYNRPAQYYANRSVIRPPTF